MVSQPVDSLTLEAGFFFWSFFISLSLSGSLSLFRCYHFLLFFLFLLFRKRISSHNVFPFRTGYMTTTKIKIIAAVEDLHGDQHQNIIRERDVKALLVRIQDVGPRRYRRPTCFCRLDLTCSTLFVAVRPVIRSCSHRKLLTYCPCRFSLSPDRQMSTNYTSSTT